MASHFRLFSRPLVFDEAGNTLAIVGELEGYLAGELYSDTLDIVNPIGKCHVQVLESTLPTGYAVRIDNVAHTVVVSWPKAQVYPKSKHSVQNGGFEDGENNWSFVKGWDVDSGYGYDSKSSARFVGVRGIVDLASDIVPAEYPDLINLGGWVQQGATSKKKAGAQVFLRWFDKDRKVLREDRSDMVTSGKKGRWTETRIYGIAPKDTAWVQPGITAFRNSQNKAVWVDDITWDHAYKVGQDTDEDYFLSIKVTDSANRVAYWSGNIYEFSTYFTSTPYPVFNSESIQYTGKFGRVVDLGPDIEYMKYGSSVRSFQLTKDVSYDSYTPQPTNIKYVASMPSVTLTQVVSYGSLTAPTENMKYSASATTVKLTVTTSYGSYSIPVESMKYSSTLRSVTLK